MANHEMSIKKVTSGHSARRKEQCERPETEAAYLKSPTLDQSTKHDFLGTAMSDSGARRKESMKQPCQSVV